MLANPFKLTKLGVLGMNRRNVQYIGRYNPRRNYPRVDNKLKSKRLAQDAGIAVPALLDVIRFNYELRTLEERLAPFESFVIKPAKGSAGKGILLVVGHGDGKYANMSGEVLTLQDIQRHISNILSGLYSLGGRNDVAMIEERIEADPVFAPYSYEGVPDVRVVVFKGFPALAMLRCSTRESGGKANLHQGGVGVGIDIGTGTAVKVVQHNRPVTHHPDTGADFSGVCVPHWRQILVLAASCYEITGLGYLGVDIVIDKKRGPLILELNARPGLAIQIANNAGEVPRFTWIEGQEEGLLPDERVALSMARFASQEPLSPKLP
jgi:alpha-L-glutamate ligase-like protein